MSRRIPASAWIAAAAAIWLSSLLAALIWRPPLPIDETRYLSVAWTMWRDGTLLVPHMNGAPYSHKPPLLFWLIHVGWATAGVSDVWARLVAPLAALAALGLTGRVAARLWPDDRQAPGAAALLLLASAFWLVWSSMTMFDMLVVDCVLVGVLGLLDARDGRGGRGWTVVAIAGGVGILSKGPVALLPIAVLAALAPLWTARPTRGGWRGWAAGGALALLGAAAIGLAWALPAAVAGGADFGERLLWGQTAGRISESFDHARAIWWYLLVLPLLVLPGALLTPAWRGIGRGWRAGDGGLRLCAAWSGGVFVAMSLISGKQAHYMLPILPALALMGAKALSLRGGASRADRLPIALLWTVLAVAGAALPLMADWIPELPRVTDVAPRCALLAAAIAGATLVPRQCSPAGAAALTAGGAAAFIVALNIAFAASVAPAYDLRPMAQRVAEWQRSGAPVAILGEADGQLSFLGRLPRPLQEVPRRKAAEWAAANPQGYILEEAGSRPNGGDPVFVQLFRDDVIIAWPATHWRRKTVGTAGTSPHG